MEFLLNSGTKIINKYTETAVKNAVEILRRDMAKVFDAPARVENEITLSKRENIGAEEFEIEAGDAMTVYAGDDLGFVYGLLYISEKFLGIKPFWFWMDQKIEKTDKIAVKRGSYKGEKPIIKYRGWFVNDEVLIMKWSINGDSTEPWRMVFEALLRCGGNTVIPGTDKNSRKYRAAAADMGLWITHHHAEPLGAEMFAREYPDIEPNYAENPELFIKLWEEGVKAQKDYKVIWTLGFRGQGDCPFWSNDSSGRFDTPEKRGRLISDIIALQRKIVEKYVDNPVFCTNLYGEIMELYDEGHITFDDDIIKISADNGYGKMVTRRRDNHTARISSMPKAAVKHGGIYYHVSFYDLQAANHMTMLPNSVDFIESELSEVISKNMTDFWIINCSNVRPHTYCLDAVKRAWYGESISDKTQSVKFADDYFNGNKAIADAYRDYHTAMAAYGSEEDEHAGEQFYTENIRLFVHAFFNEKFDGTPGIRWLVGTAPLAEQIERFCAVCAGNLDNIEAYYNRCADVSKTLDGGDKRLFDATLMLHAALHYNCTLAVTAFGDAYKEYLGGNMKEAFVLFGDCAELFDNADKLLHRSEYGVWQGFYFNDCFADFKHTAYMVKKLRGYVRERGDNARHDKWYRDTMYSREDRNIMTLLVNDNHMTDDELYKAMKEKGESAVKAR